MSGKKFSRGVQNSFTHFLISWKILCYIFWWTLSMHAIDLFLEGGICQKTITFCSPLSCLVFPIVPELVNVLSFKLKVACCIFYVLLLLISAELLWSITLSKNCLASNLLSVVWLLMLISGLTFSSSLKSHLQFSHFGKADKKGRYLGTSILLNRISGFHFPFKMQYGFPQTSLSDKQLTLFIVIQEVVPAFYLHFFDLALWVCSDS